MVCALKDIRCMSKVFSLYKKKHLSSFLWFGY